MKNWLYILFIPCFFLSCSKDENANIPLVRVDITIYTNDPAYNPIAVPGTWMYVNGGSKGIVIYRSSEDNFIAYDRHCTYDPNNTCSIVSVEKNNISLLDDCCGSKFLLTDGAVIKNPASLPLKQYKTSYDGSVLRIFN
ncbi:MAG: hypothetical protein ACPGSL_00220 [Vicingaceae bacterium]